MSGGNVILNNSEIQELVEISMLLGCTADMIKEPKVFICFLMDHRFTEVIPSVCMY